MALQPGSQTDMYNRRRQNGATGAPGSTTTAAVRPTEGAQGPGKSYYSIPTANYGSYWQTSKPGTSAAQQPPGSSPEPTPWTPYSPPGYGEQWYAQNAWKWNQPSAVSN